jgi:hypothetical protein
MMIAFLGKIRRNVSAVSASTRSIIDSWGGDYFRARHEPKMRTAVILGKRKGESESGNLDKQRQKRME